MRSPAGIAVAIALEALPPGVSASETPELFLGPWGGSTPRLR